MKKISFFVLPIFWAALLNSIFFLLCVPSIAEESFFEIEFGPYDKADTLSGRYRYAFCYQKDGKNYLNVNGKDYGPYDYFHFGDKLKMEKIWGFLHQKGDQKEFHIIVNGKEWGPFTPAPDLAPDTCFKISRNHWGVLHLKGDKQFVLIDGIQEYGPYESVKNYSLDRNGWHFIIIKGDTLSVHVNGKEWGPYPAFGAGENNFLLDFAVTGNLWRVVYQDDKFTEILILNGLVKKWDEDDPDLKQFEDEFWRNDPYREDLELTHKVQMTPFVSKKGSDYFVTIKGTSYGPFTIVEEEGFLTQNNWAFVFGKELNSGNRYVMANGKEYGPISEEDSLFMQLQVSNTHWGYEFERDAKFYLMFDGKEYGPYQPIFGTMELMLEITDSNFGFAYMKKGRFCIQINGKEFGPDISLKYINTSEPYWLIHREEDGKHYVRIGRGAPDKTKHPIP